MLYRTRRAGAVLPLAGWWQPDSSERSAPGGVQRAVRVDDYTLNQRATAQTAAVACTTRGHVATPTQRPVKLQLLQVHCPQPSLPYQGRYTGHQ